MQNSFFEILNCTSLETACIILKLKVAPEVARLCTVKMMNYILLGLG